MAAWNHTNNWTNEYYKAYRKYVTANASSMKGREEDCADLSMLLIVNFAAQEGLPLTFTDNNDIRYSSKEGGQIPEGGTHLTYEKVYVPSPFPPNPGTYRGGPPWGYTTVDVPNGIMISRNNYKWSNKDEYYKAVINRISAKALYHKNTEVNPLGPQAGDLLLSDGHAGLVINSYPPGVPHPKAADTGINSWVDQATALKEVNVLEYFRDNHGVLNDENKAKNHFDYLNHRGSKKPKAELIYFRRAEDAQKDGFEFRKYNYRVLAS